MYNMDPEIKKLLEKTAQLTEENNVLLRKMNRRARWGSIMHLLYWIVILGFSFSSYYFIQPYLNKILSTYSSFQTNVSGLNGGIDKLKALNPF